ncbi:GNAT family N-acetyltransferase [bacterium]|nr:GNAT family N-acetyltransferase [bacterium]
MSRETVDGHRIRYYRPEDRSGIRKVCAETGFLGEPIDPLFEDRELFADFLTSPYTDAEPGCCLVLETSEGRIVGYILGSRSSWRHHAYLLWRFPGWLLRAVFGYFFSYGADSRAYLRWLLFRGKRETPPTPAHGVHFHINLLPEVRGLRVGKALFDTFLDRMAELGEKSVFGQVVVKEDRRTERMFARFGFQMTARSEVSKFQKKQSEPVYLCTLVQARDRTPPRRSPRLLLSLHDFHPGSRAQIVDQLEFCLSRCPGHVSILVIPQHHHGVRVESCSDSLKFLGQCQEQGHDLAIHGFYHDRKGLPKRSWWWTQFYTQNEAEFFSLPIDEAEGRIRDAREIWRREGWRANGFVAPGWLYPRPLEKSLGDMGFTYTCTLRDLVHLPSGKRDRAWAGAYSLRSPWRRGLARLWHPIWREMWGGKPVVRLSLHPRDLEVPFVRKQLGVFLEELSGQGYSAHSYADHVQS